MSLTDPIPSSPDPDVAETIVRAEFRRGRLERLSEMGMEMAEEVRERMINSPYHPEPRHEPGKAFAAVSRAVRLTFAFEARIDMDILAIRKGKLVLGSGGSAAGSALSWLPSAPGLASHLDDPPCSARAEVPGAVWEAVDREVGDAAAREAMGRVHEHLVDREDDEAFFARPWRDCVTAICADLGVSPDESLWSEETDYASSVTRSGEGGLAASGREPVGGKARGLEFREKLNPERPDIPSPRSRLQAGVALPTSGEGGRRSHYLGTPPPRAAAPSGPSP